MSRAARTVTVALVAAALGVASGCSDPADVVHAAADAARAGDRAAYAACFTERSRPILGAWWKAAGAARPELSGMGAGEVTVTAAQEMSPTPEGHARVALTVSEAGHGELPLVVHDRAGAWRIDLIDSERALTGLSRPF